MSATTETRQCSRCHARVALQTASACPACGGELVPDTSPAATIPSQVDHRGIVLPPRHAVGGIITPR